MLLVFGLTLLEYITGLIFIKGMKIKLWDYSKRWGNIQGIICPLFSLFWGIIAAIFVYWLFDPLNIVAQWAAGNIWVLFAVGIFYGVFLTDLCISFNVSLKIRKVAVQFKTAVHSHRAGRSKKNNLRGHCVRRQVKYSVSYVVKKKQK